MTEKILDVNLINPFVLATIEVMDTMAKVKPVRTGLHLKQKSECCFGDVSGVVGFAGDVIGNVAVSFPKNVAIKLVGNLIDEEPDWDSRYLLEGIGEFGNMIAGSAKGKVSKTLGLLYNISLPSVIKGKNHYVTHPSNMPVMVVQFSIENIGIFTLELCVRR